MRSRNSTPVGSLICNIVPRRQGDRKPANYTIITTHQRLKRVSRMAIDFEKPALILSDPDS